jgi:hypothetical protein
MEIRKETFKNNITYVSIDCLSFGDYDNSGAVERANVKVLKEKYQNCEKYSFQSWQEKERYINWETGYEDILPTSDIVELYGDFGSTQIWIREDIDQEEGYINSLSNYPVIDDESVSETENEIEKESWNNWIRGDLSTNLLSNIILTKIDKYHVEDNDLFECYCQAKEIKNEYFIVESGGIGWIDIEEIGAEYRKQVIMKLVEVRKQRGIKPRIPESLKLWEE